MCSEGGVLETQHLGLPRSDGASPASSSPSGAGQCLSDERGELLSLAEAEKRQILAALQRSKGNRTHAAKMLGMSIRTLRNKLNEYNFKAADDGPESEEVE